MRPLLFASVFLTVSASGAGACTSHAAAARTTVYGTVTKAPTTPVCIAGRPCSAPAAHVTILFYRGAVPVASALTTGTGTYRVALAPGTYTARAGAKSSPGRGLERGRFSVGAHTLHRNFLLDTGIR